MALVCSNSRNSPSVRTIELPELVCQLSELAETPVIFSYVSNSCIPGLVAVVSIADSENSEYDFECSTCLSAADFDRQSDECNYRTSNHDTNWRTERDVSYARIVKKPQTTNTIFYKEDYWGARYSHKRYIMNTAINNSLQRILRTLSPIYSNIFFRHSECAKLINRGFYNKIQQDMICFENRVGRNAVETLQQAFQEFGRFFFNNRLLCANQEPVLYELNHMEAIFEHLLEVHFGEWNTVY